MEKDWLKKLFINEAKPAMDRHSDSSGGTGGGSGGGATVYEALSWKGTAVPREGEVETVYINNKLSTQQVLDIITPILDAEKYYNEEYGYYESAYVYIISDENGDNGLEIYANYFDDGSLSYLSIDSWAYDAETDDWLSFYYFEHDTEDIENRSGWCFDTTDFSFSFNNIAVSSASGCDIGQYNSQLTQLFSATPFSVGGKETVMELSGEYDGTSINASNGMINVESLLVAKKLPLKINTPLVTLLNAMNGRTEQLSGRYYGYNKKITQNGTVDLVEGLKYNKEIPIQLEVDVESLPGTIEWQHSYQNNGLCYTIDDNYCYILSRFGNVVDPESSFAYVLPSDCQQEWKSLDNIVIQYGSKELYQSLCANCTELTTIIIPNSVQHLGAETFKKCTSLQNVILPNSIVRIGHGVFSGCDSLSQIIIPDSVKYIGFEAFSYCKKLSRITLPSSLIQIDTMAFDVCIALSDIDFKGTKAQWNAITKGTSWNTNTGNYTIHCTDGDIPKA